MKTLNLLAIAVLATAAGIVWAEGSTKTSDEVAVAVEKTRAQVKAETLEARRLGLIVYGDRDIPAATSEQDRQIALAGPRAREREDVAHNAQTK